MLRSSAALAIIILAQSNVIQVDPALLKAVNDFLQAAGPLGLFFLIVGGFIFLLIRMNGTTSKSTDAQVLIMKSMTHSIELLTSNQEQMTTSARKRDDQMDKITDIQESMNAKTDENTGVLRNLVKEQQTGNAYVLAMSQNLNSYTTDTSDAVAEMSKHISGVLTDSNAALEAKVDTLPDRVIAAWKERVTPLVAHIDATVIERTHSIEDLIDKQLIRRYMSELENAQEIIKLRDDTIVALNKQIEVLKTEQTPKTEELTTPPN